MKSLFLSVVMICFAFFVKGQTRVFTGTVVDQHSKKPVLYANVTLRDKDNTIITYKATDSKGAFAFHLEGQADVITLEINYLGYQKFQKKLSNNDSQIVIELVPKATMLDEIKVKSRPRINRSGDTLSYNVQSFSKLEDRSIGDVLKRMPGIEITDNGQIKYQGRAISNFYVDGDDLLDDRYAIGTRTIPHHIVQDIQVMTNHEHMKVMKNKRYTENVALNLVIKDDAKLQLTTQAKLAAGLPGQYDGEINNHLLNKKVKFLNVLSGNNIGQSYKNELIGHNQKTLLSRIGNAQINNLLSFGTVESPPVKNNQYIFNNSFSLNANNSFELKNDWVGKINFNGVQNSNSTDYFGERTYIIDKEQFGYKETQSEKMKEFLGILRVNAVKNVEKKFINARLSLEFENQNRKATLLNNSDTLRQYYKHRVQGFTAHYEYVPELKNKSIIHSDLFINYGTKPQKLSVTPGVFASLYTDSIAYQSTIQEVNVPQFFANYSLSYRLTKWNISHAYKAGLLLENQNLSSTLAVLQDPFTSVRLASDSSANHMRWNRMRYYMEPSYDWSYKKLMASISLPFSLQSIRYSDPLYRINERKNDVLFNPEVRIKQKLGYESELHFNYSYNNNFGTIENVYRGIIMRNYRTLVNNSSAINESSNHKAEFTFRAGRAIKLKFYNVGIAYSQNTINNIVSSKINNEIIETELLPMQNTTKSYSANAGYDFYIFALSSALKLKGSVALTEFNQLLNDRLLPFQNIVYSFNPQFEFKIWKGYNVTYNGNISFTQSRQTGDTAPLNRTFKQFFQEASLPFNVHQNVHIKLSANHMFTQQIESKNLNYIFSNLFIRYRSPKLKTDVELSIENLSNIKRFETYNTNVNFIAYSSYQLRGRFGILRVVFNL